jgi:hypothetical protein
MRVAISAGALLTAAMLFAMPAAVARAQVEPEPVDSFFGELDVVPDLVANHDRGKSSTNAIAIVYDNTLSAANFGISSTDLSAVWGDELLTTGTGLLTSQRFSLYNPGTSAGPLLTATIGVTILDAGTSALLGGYSVSVNFGAGLNPGSFSLVSVTGIDPLLINLTSTDIIVLQRVVSFTGAANRLGVASLTPPTVGSSPGTMYITASTVGGGTAGFYTIATGPANPAWQVGVIPPPVPTVSRSWSQLKKLYR